MPASAPNGDPTWAQPVETPLDVPGSDEPPLLALGKIRKSFDGICVLDAKGIEVRSGHVYGLMGANGSGKSTFVGVLTGYQTPDRGSFGELRGLPIRWPIDGAAESIVIVPQDKGLCANLSVLDNMLVTRRRRRRQLLKPVHRREEHDRAVAALGVVGLHVDPWRLIGDLSPAEQALVSLARAFEELNKFGSRGSLLVLDEPTTNLGLEDASRILAATARLASEGAAVIIVNHRLAEIRSACESVFVLRNGEITQQGRLKDLDDESLVRAMFGSVEMPGRAEAPSGEAGIGRVNGQQPTPLMTVVSIPSKGSYAELKLTVYPNEVLGVTGLTGMGQDVLPYQIAGVLPGHATNVEVQGKKVKKGPIAARRAGIVCVPANRRAHAFWMDGTVRENYTIANLQHFMKRGFLRRPEERAASDSFFSEWRIAARGIESPMSTLSGGNQQKVSIARAVSSSDWRVLLVHEPTQGIDITTRAEVLSRLRALCTVDRSVVIFGADYDALAEACDRVIVLRQGSGTVELEAHDLSEEAIAFAAMKARRDEG